LYLAAGALAVPGYESDKSLSTDLDAVRERLNSEPELRAAFVRRLEPFMAQNTEALALLHKASALEFSSLSPGTEYNYRTASFWTLADVGQMRAQSLCLSGTPSEAVESVVETLRLQRVERRIDVYSARGFGVVPFVLSHCEPSPRDLAQLQQTVDDRLRDVPTAAAWLSRSLIDMRIRMLGSMWQMYGVDVRAPEHVNFRNWPLDAVIMRPWYTNRFVGQLRSDARMIEAVKKPARERAAAIAAAQPTEAFAFTRNGRVQRFAVEGATVRQMAWGLASFTRMMSTRAAIAAEQYRRDHDGQPPGALDDLVPRYLDTTPADPYTDAPLRYVRTATGYAVYGVGEDGKDDGGDVRPGPRKWQSGPPSDPRDVGVLILTAGKAASR
jgi:hypothetical protein